MSTQENNTDFLRPKPLKYKEIFKKYNVKILDVAQYINFNYYLLVNGINNKYPLSNQVLASLDDIVAKLEA